MIIKRYTGDAWEALYPKTLMSRLYDDSGTNTLFNESGKLKEAYLPDSVFDSLFFYDAVSTNVLLKNIANLAVNSLTNRSVVGCYWVASSPITITANNTESESMGLDPHYYITRLKPSDGSAELTNGPHSIETGDWFILTNITGLGVSGDPYVVTFAVVNNTYELASATVDGIVKIGSNTVQTVAANEVSETAGRTYGIQKNASGQLVVNVPWSKNDIYVQSETPTGMGPGALWFHI